MLKVLELFGGIGACSKALERIGIDFEVVDYVEIDKYAVKSYNAMHNTNFEPQDIMTYDKDLEVDLIMHGSPCQDFSLAGRQAGGDKDSGTRSSLMFETLRIVEKLKPTYVIWENVKNVISKRHKHNFDEYLKYLESLGYTNYWQVLNAKDYGIPQNRERVFVVSVLNNQPFTFPPKQELKLKLKDMIESEVDEKYYLSKEIINKIQNITLIQERKRIQEKDYKDTKCGEVEPCDFRYDEGIRTRKDLTIIPCLTCKVGTSGVSSQPLLKIKEAPNIDVVVERNFGSKGKEVDLTQPIPTLTTSMGTGSGNVPIIKSKCKRLESLVYKTKFEEGKVLNMDLYNQTTNENISQCLTEPHHNSQRLFDGLRIRKLTPKECWRLMGFDDSDFEKTQKVNSDTQLYKQAGNSIVVNVLEKIFKNLLKGE